MKQTVYNELAGDLQSRNGALELDLNSLNPSRPMMQTMDPNGVHRHPRDPRAMNRGGGAAVPEGRMMNNLESNRTPQKANFAQERSFKSAGQKNQLFGRISHNPERKTDGQADITPWSLQNSSPQLQLQDSWRNQRTPHRPNHTPRKRPTAPPTSDNLMSTPKRFGTEHMGRQPSMDPSRPLHLPQHHPPVIAPPFRPPENTEKLVERRNSVYSYSGISEPFLKKIVNNEWREDLEMFPGLEKYVNECRTQLATARDLKFKMLTLPYTGPRLQLKKMTKSK